MILFIYGEDSYRSRRKLNEILKHYKNTKRQTLSFNVFNFQEAKSWGAGDIFPELKREISQFSMFEEKKFFVLIDAFSDKIFKEKFLEETDNVLNSDDIFLFYESEKINEKDLLFKFLRKEAKSQEFKLLEGQNLKNWIKKELNGMSVRIEPRALDKFLLFVSNDLWQISNELRKLANFKKGSVINSEDIDLMIKPKIETDIFKTIEAISKKEKKQALNLLRKHIENGDSPLYLLSMINFQFRNLLIIKDLIERGTPYYLISQKAGLHPFVVKKSFEISKKFRMSELKKIYQEIFEADFDIKTGKTEPEIALDLLVAGI